MIRLILVVIFLIFFAIYSIIALPIEWIIGKFNQDLKDRSSLRIVKNAFKIVKFLSGTKTKVIGYENVPKDEPVVFIGNHRGFFDTVVSYSMMPSITGFISKDSVKKVPILRAWMKNLYCLFINRQNTREGLKTILEGIEQLKDGKSIVIFPEGTRNKGDGIQEFHAGSFKLAEKSGCKIIPMVQNNTEEVLEKHFPFIKSAKTVIEFGKPIDVSTFSKEEKRNIPEYTRNVMLEIYEKNKQFVK